MPSFADARIHPIEWVIEDLFPRGAPTLINAAAGTGKSILGLHMSLCILTGQPWLGHKVTQSPVAYWDQDNPDSLLTQNRIVAIAKGMNLEIPHSPRSDIFRLGYRVGDNPRKRDDLIAQLKDLGAAVVFADTLAAINSGAERDSDAATRTFEETFFPICDAGITPIIFHHTGKEIILPTGKTARRKGIDAARGSSALVGSAGTVFNLFPNGRGNLELSNAKPRYGKPPVVEIEYDEDGYMGDESFSIKISRAEPQYSLTQLSQLLLQPESEPLRKLSSRQLVKSLEVRHIIVSQSTAARALKRWAK